MTTLRNAVKYEMRRAAAGRKSRCVHLASWPTKEQIFSGAIDCPYCLLLEMAKLAEEMSAAHKADCDGISAQWAAAEERSVQLNEHNTRLQRFAIELCDRPEHAAALMEINKEA